MINEELTEKELQLLHTPISQVPKELWSTLTNIRERQLALIAKSNQKFMEEKSLQPKENQYVGKAPMIVTDTKTRV